jgi:tetratricopeptide (TPR) repeat protein
MLNPVAVFVRFLALAGLAMSLAAAPLPTDAPPAAAPPELDAEVLYDILVAEVAMQREQPLEAYVHYMAAVRQAPDPQLAELATRAAIAAQAQAQAQEAAALWIELAPDALPARQLAAYVALEADDPEQALPYLRAIMDRAEDHRHGYLYCARLVARLSDPVQRLALMRTLIDEYGEDADALLAIAGLAANAEQLDLARDYAERAAAERPAWSRPWQFLARMLVDAGQLDQALTELERYFSQGFDDLELRTLYAQLLIEAERFEAARASFAALLESHPDMPGMLFAAGALSLQLQDDVAARDYLLRLLEHDEHRQDALFMLGQVEESADQLEPARDWYAQVRGEKYTDAQVRLASVEARLGHVERAREILQHLRETASAEQQPALLLIEGEILREVDATQAAMALYDQALARYPDHIDLLYARALLAAQLGQVEILERDLRRVLSMDPDHADALNALGYTLADQTDRLEEARRFITRALELEPQQPAILDSMGWLLYRLGKPHEAVVYLRRALEHLSDGEIAAHLGEVLWALGQHAEARAVWQQALDEHPDHDYLRRVIERHPVDLQQGAES